MDLMVVQGKGKIRNLEYVLYVQVMRQHLLGGENIKQLCQGNLIKLPIKTKYQHIKIHNQQVRGYQNSRFSGSPMISCISVS